MAKRSPNSHQVRLRELPHVARLHRVDPFRTANGFEIDTAAERIAGPRGRYSYAGWYPAGVDHTLILLETRDEADAMQRCIRCANQILQPTIRSHEHSRCEIPRAPIRSRNGMRLSAFTLWDQ